MAAAGCRPVTANRRGMNTRVNRLQLEPAGGRTRRMAAAGTQATFLRQRSATDSRAVRRVRIAAVAIVVLSATACGGRSPTRPPPPPRAPRRTSGTARRPRAICSTSPRYPPPDPALARLRRGVLPSRSVHHRQGCVGQLFDAWCAANGQKSVQSVKPGATISDRSSFTCTVPPRFGERRNHRADEDRRHRAWRAGVPDRRASHADFLLGGGGRRTAHPCSAEGHWGILQARPDAFWREMQTRGWTWLRDADGKTIAPEALPKNLGLKQFANDQYRGVVLRPRHRLQPG